MERFKIKTNVINY